MLFYTSGFQPRVLFGALRFLPAPRLSKLHFKYKNQMFNTFFCYWACSPEIVFLQWPGWSDTGYIVFHKDNIEKLQRKAKKDWWQDKAGWNPEASNTHVHKNVALLETSDALSPPAGQILTNSHTGSIQFIPIKALCISFVYSSFISFWFIMAMQLDAVESNTMCQMFINNNYDNI